MIAAEDLLAKFDEALRANLIQREQQARKLAEEQAEQQRVLAEKEAARVASERSSCELYETLAKVYGGAAGQVIHTTVSEIHIFAFFSLFHFCYTALYWLPTIRERMPGPGG